MSAYTVIIADGSFPNHEIPLCYLKNASRIICCDGSAENLLNAGYIPDAIVGDMDSTSEDLTNRFADRIFLDESQDTNDLTKTVCWCSERGYTDIVIVGATGKREDHTIGNISLLAEYIKDVSVIMVTDTGILHPYLKGSTISSFPGQQVSIFAIDTEAEISSKGLRYPLNRKKIDNWWVATLNEALGDTFTLEFNQGRVIVYLKFADPRGRKDNQLVKSFPLGGGI
ncbi:MAG: thiamine diphosphokinase [Bacteroidia bacterium]|nr:thiamine diphosphokinase [Bacteroidia bacterium]